MILIEHTATDGWQAAIRGMRNPKNSWEKSDTTYRADGAPFIGDRDLKLMSTLSQAGTDHGKFLRFINVSCDIVAPVYWVAELDTYKVGTTRNSCSLQHKGAERGFAWYDFSHELHDDLNADKLGEVWGVVLDELEVLRRKFNETGDYTYFRQMRQLMPMGYNYRFTWCANYAVLRNIYHARKNHKLEEWHEFCEWIKCLPYATELICT